MKVLVTGHHGYIGSILTPRLVEAGHDVVGLDCFYFEGCDFGSEGESVPCLRKDLRDVVAADLEGFEAVVHLAALSNDPLGNLAADCTYDINHRASVQLARLAKSVGVTRFIFSSSCSLYGQAGDELLTEEAAFNPITPYGESKVLVEKELAGLADEKFSPTSLRNATAYGVSPRLRADVMVNNLVGYAHLTGEVLVKSDGTPWRPLVHVRDIAAAFIAVLQAPRAMVRGQAFNVGRSDENYRVSEVADLVRELLPGTVVTYAGGGGPDPRCYRVNCDKLPRLIPEYRPQWTVPKGIEELRDAYRANRLSSEDFFGARYVRLERIAALCRDRRLDAALRWR